MLTDRPLPYLPAQISVPDGAISLWERPAEGPTVLFLHGWSLDHRVWLPQFEGRALANFQLAAIDRRGFGNSSAPADLSREVDDLLLILDQLDINRAIVIGQSQAGRVALQFALEHGDRVAGLGLVGTPVAGFSPPAKAKEDVPIDFYRELVAAGKIDEMKRLWARHPMLSEHPLVSAMLRSYDGRDLLAPPPPPGPRIDQIGKIVSPALVVTGRRDTAWRRLVGDAIAYGLPRGRRVDLPEAGHLCNLDAPLAFDELVREFIESLD